MGIFSRPNKPSDEVHLRNLGFIRNMFEGGSDAAAAIGMIYCDTHDIDLPPWLLKSATQALCDAVVGNKPKRRGRAGSTIGRLRQDLIDYERWSTVKEVREWQTRTKEQVECVRTLSDEYRSYREDREKMLAWGGHTLDRAFECAAMLNLGTVHFAGPEAMKASYLRVERNCRLPKGAGRYCILDFETMRRLGLTDLIASPMGGRKMLPIYNLTL